MGNRAVLTYKNPCLTVPFVIPRIDQPTSLGGLIRKYRIENDLFAKELAKIIGVDEETILNWEKDRTVPSQRCILLLKEKLKIDPFELVEFGATSERQKAILNLITEKGTITRAECQVLLGIPSIKILFLGFSIKGMAHVMLMSWVISPTYHYNSPLPCV